MEYNKFLETKRKTFSKNRTANIILICLKSKQKPD